jgi:hypothetical protein
MEKWCVILPEGKVFDRIFVEGIAPIGPARGVELTRISTDLSLGKIAGILATLKSCSQVIADVSAKNPNVMFLAGCARALDRPILYITQHAEGFPFTEAPVVYGADPSFLRTELLAQVTAGPGANGGAEAEEPRAKFIAIFGDLLQKHGYEHRGPVQQDAPNVFTLVDQDMDLSLVQEIARRGRELNIRVRLM